jgi:16S rRNA (cytosine967-C5)-methyltransferase
MPKWLSVLLRKQYDPATLTALAQSLLDIAPVDFRVNLLKTDRKTVLAELNAQGIAATATPYSPLGIRILDKQNLAQSDWYRQGLIEVQDEGSQLIALLLGAKRNEWVIDFCAGAGGKTLAIGAMMRATGRLYAFDTSAERLGKLQPRLDRSGLSKVVCQIIEDEDARLAKWHRRADRVLVDAPCSGLGTLRRNPALKWQYQPKDIERYPPRQFAILTQAADLVKPGGVLVYATCSLLRMENEAVVEQFLKQHPEFVRESAKTVFEKQGITGIGQDDLHLLPHQHQTDAFYAARLRRQER